MNKYIHLEHGNGYSCDPIRTIAGALIIISCIAIPAALVSHRIGYTQGVASGVNKVHAAINQSIEEGLPFTFRDNDIQLIITIKTDSSWFRRSAKERADSYESVRYRAIMEYGPDGI